ncbi:SulP family inorganic anion transporter [Paenibacillus daejeonensis]|uniref:SulP family inorganic anion transporter n=1 Tax=Paenibacillus daejeonensis TaxID=135193 RepID=UPI0003633495|nr:SulP family inorganic anion transporter [Paenibacillus daejeonensis]
MFRSDRFEGYSVASFRQDVLSGIVVGIIALPLGMAFAIASGVSPEYGIITTVVAGILTSLLGGSRFQIGGPTGAFIPVLFAIVMQYGYENLLIAGCLAGAMLVVMGLLKLGSLIQFIPRPVITGFTTGIAVIIFSGQLANFLGLSDLPKHEDFLSNMREIALHVTQINLYAVVIALSGLAAMLLTARYARKLPPALTGIVIATAVSMLLFKGQSATIGSAFGVMSGSFPAPALPEFTWARIVEMLRPALVIAMLGGIESLLSAVVADRMTGTKHNSNRELIGQGIANLVTPLFGGIPATGAIARTAANIRNGAVSPLSGMIHGLFVLLVLLLLAPYASHIPLAAMAPILMVVAWNMSERKEFVRTLRTKTGDSLVLVVTFLLTVFASLPTAVEVGLLLAAVIFIKRMSESMRMSRVLPDTEQRHGKVNTRRVELGHACPQVRLLSVEGSLFFGASGGLASAIAVRELDGARIVLLRMGRMPYLDMTGESELGELLEMICQSGGQLLLSGLHRQPANLLARTGLLGKVGEDQIFAHTGEAIARALELLDTDRCKGCTRFAFRECEALSRQDSSTA